VKENGLAFLMQKPPPLVFTRSNSAARLRRPDCREKTLDLLLQALGQLCEFAGRTEHQFDGGSTWPDDCVTLAMFCMTPCAACCTHHTAGRR
jgi:hypothetical protein